MTLASDAADKTVSPSPSKLSIEKEQHNSSRRAREEFQPSAHGFKPEESSTEDAEDMETLSKIATSDYPHALKLTFIVIALVLSIFLVALDSTIVATAIPRITDEFHSLDQVGWYGSAFFLTLGAFQSTWGKAYKYFPLKPTFLITIGIFELGSLICGVAQDSTTLIVGRAIAGMGGAGIASGAYTIIAFAVPPGRRPAFTGLLGASYGCASVVGPLLGGVFTSHATWRWCFYVNLPIGSASALVIFLFFQTPAASKPVKASLQEKILQMDPLGTFTIMAAIVCFLLALQWGGVTKAWSDPSVIGTLVGFGLLLVVFGAVEWYMGDRAVLQGALLGRREILVSCLYNFFSAGAFFVMLYYLPLYFQSVDNVSASESGIRNIPLVLGVAFFTILSGGLISAYGVYVPFLLAGSAIATIGAGLLYTLDIGSPSSHWIGYQALFGMGIGLSIQVPIIANQAFVKSSEVSSVTAVTLSDPVFQTIGGAIFVSAGQAAYSNRLKARIPALVPGVSPALVVATGATELRDVFSAEQIPGIVLAYMDGLRLTFALAVALAGVTLPIAIFAKWWNVKQKVPGVAV